MLHSGSYPSLEKNNLEKILDVYCPVVEHVFLSLFCQKTPCAVFSKSVDFTASSEGSFFFSFTGKELDAETGYSYFGARYLDHALTTAWLSVDPMSDKYPSISPYAYCAWNPYILKDNRGDSLTLFFLNDNDDNTVLLNNLASKTGLLLYYENGKILYQKDDNGDAIANGGSVSARNDLIHCINDNAFDLTIYVGVYKSEDVEKGKSDLRTSESYKGNLYLNTKDFSSYDHPTFDIGMVFLHELQHGYFGLEDDGEKTIYNYGSKYGTYYNGTVGTVVSRVNQYRMELNLPLRDAYESNPYEGDYFNKIPFRSKGGILWL